jgi:hypothetical protein
MSVHKTPQRRPDSSYARAPKYTLRFPTSQRVGVIEAAAPLLLLRVAADDVPTRLFIVFH